MLKLKIDESDQRHIGHNDDIKRIVITINNYCFNSIQLIVDKVIIQD